MIVDGKINCFRSSSASVYRRLLIHELTGASKANHLSLQRGGGGELMSHLARVVMLAYSKEHALLPMSEHQ